MSRSPELISVSAARDDDERNFERGKRPGFVDLLIIMRGIKGQPIETHRVSNDEALRFAADLIRAVRRSGASDD